MKKIFSFLCAFAIGGHSAFAIGPTLSKDIDISGANSKVSSGTFSIQTGVLQDFLSGSTLTIERGATFNAADGSTVNLKSISIPGAITTTQLATPSAPTITHSGTAGAATWSYKIVAKQPNGATTAASAAGSTTSGNATLTSGNYNIITWTAVSGASAYDIYRTAVGTSPSTIGKITTISNGALSYNDTGGAGDASIAPATNTTADITAGGKFSGPSTGLSVFVASGGSHAPGIVPDPGSTSGSTKFLREDATFAVPAGSGVFGASGGSHSTGLVPDPGSSTGSTKFLREDATFAVPSGSGGGDYTKITETVLGSDTASVTFSSIAGTYRTLVITYQARGTAGSGDPLEVGMQFNSDTGSNYEKNILEQNSSSGSAAFSTGSTTSIASGYVPASTATSGAAGSAEITIVNYAGTTFWKNSFTLAKVAGANRITTMGGAWKSTSAITAVKLQPNSGNFLTGSVFTLYGVN